MGKKFKLIGMSGEILHNAVIESIISFIKNNYAKANELTQQQKIIDYIRQEFKISSGKIRDILENLVKRRKISTIYDKPNRYYGPPKIPLPIKVCITMVTIIFSLYLIIDILVPKEYIRNVIYLSNPISSNILHINIFPFAIIGVTITIVICAIWYRDFRKLYK